jgi:alpha-tubulin suppressor-like RCC1 family protein
VLTKDGLIYTWGSNVFGQLGNGTTQGVLVPTLIPLPAGVAAAALVPESGSTSAYLITAPGGRNGR